MLRHLSYEIRKQSTSLTFIAILILFTVFVFTQFSEIPHLPARNKSDIAALERSGERDYIFVAASEQELMANTLQFIRQRIDEGTIPQESAHLFNPVISMLQSGEYSFEDVLATAHRDEYVFPWISTAKAQFQDNYGTVDEVNQNLREAIGINGYSIIFYEKYVTYMQVISTLLIFPIFLLLFTKDYRQNMYEIVYAQPLSPMKYILIRYLSALIPILVYLYALGLMLNGFSAIRFLISGWEYSYTPFITYYLLYLLPTVTFLSAFIMFLMLLIRKAIAVFPIYILYAIFNVTPDVFGGGRLTNILYRSVVRLDTQEIILQEVIANRLLYLALALLFIFIGCRLYKRVRHDLRKAVAI